MQIRALVLLGALTGIGLVACDTLEIGPNFYACDRSGKNPDEQCPFGLHCGVQGYCYDRADAGELPCVQGADDCAPSWRCDLSGVCRRREPGAWACAIDGGLPAVLVDAGVTSDELCEGWRCGIDGRCHPREPGPWPCAADPDCEGGWRCGIDGRCQDPSAEAIPWDELPASMGYQRVNPRFISSPPSLVAVAGPDDPVSPSDRTEPGWDEDFAAAMVFPRSNDKSSTLAHVRAREPNKSNPDPDAEPGFVSAQGTFAGKVFSLATTNLGPVALGDDGSGPRVFRYHANDDGSLVVLKTWPVNASELRVMERTPFTGFAFSPGAQGGTLISMVSTQALDLPKNLAHPKLLDATSFISWTYPIARPSPRRWLIVATPDGFYAYHLDEAAPGGIPANPEMCVFEKDANSVMLGGTGDRTVQLRATPQHQFGIPPGGALAVRSLSIDESGFVPVTIDHLWLLGVSNRIASGGQYCDPAQLPQDVLLGPCKNPCLDAQMELRQFMPLRTWDLSGGAIDVECAPPGVQGATAAFRLTRGLLSGCVATPISLPESGTSLDHLRTSPLSGGVLASVGGHGQFLVGTALDDAQSLTLTRSPDFFVHGVTGYDVVPVFHRGVALNTALGITEFPADVDEYLEFVAAVGRQPWTVHRAGLVTHFPDTRLLAYLDTTVHEFEPPFNADFLPHQSGDGGYLTVTAFDHVLSARIDDAAANGPQPAPGGMDGGTDAVTLDLRLTPFAGNPIVALAATPTAALPDGGVALAGGYLATQERAWRFWAETDRKWRTQELSLPDGEIRKVWVDRFGRGRAGFRDGTIVSLPSGFVLAGPIAEEVGVADFADVCGRPWVVTAEGVYQLVPAADSAVGQWEQLLAEGDQVGGWTVQGLGSARLGVGDERVLLFSAVGDVIEFTVPDCHGEGAP